MKGSHSNEPVTLTNEDRDRVQDFVSTYNTIDGELRRRLRLGRDVPFSRVVNDFQNQHPLWLDVGYLKTAGDLRNLLVHEPRRPYDYVAVPTLAMLTRLKEVCRRLLNPDRVLPKFAKRVETVAPQDSLAHVLRQIAARDFSQFPIYSGATFKGLLTENGITRWLARHVTGTLSIVELEDVSVRQVVPEEEGRANWAFAARDEEVESVREMFAAKELLEAVLITQTGKRSESPLGIVTRWDIIH
jgi:predicted transcriptional regulator